MTDSTCQNCLEEIALTDVQGHYSGLCAQCRVDYEHPRDAGDAVIAESHRQEMEDEKEKRRQQEDKNDVL